jgi:hypothetical protein
MTTDLRLDEPIAGEPTAEDVANLAIMRKAQALAPGLFLVRLVGSPEFKPVEECSDRELLALSAFARKQRDERLRELVAETDAEDRAGVRGELVGRDDSVQRLEYHDWHPAV